MAKKEEQQDRGRGASSKEGAKLIKALINDLNKDEKTKIAWNLATDGDNPTTVTEFISTQSTLLDYIISNRRDGGVPVGKLTEFCGEEASGKSLICAHLIAECQRRGGLAVYIDTENACSPDFMRQIGVNVEQMVYVQPGTIEEVGEAIQKIIVSIRTNAPDRLVLILWDSVAGTPSKAEVEGEYDLDMNAALSNAKALAKMMRKLTQVWGKERIAMVFTNQLKTKIGVMYGDPMHTPGGKAIPYTASVRVRLNRSVQLQDGKKVDVEGDSGEVEAKGKGGVVGIHTIAKVIKNRLGPPLRRCEFDIFFDRGIDDVRSWFPALHARGLIEKASGWCYYTSFPSGKKSTWRADSVDHVDEDRGLQFRESGWAELLAENPELKKHVLDDIERCMVVRFDGRPVADQQVDPESLQDAECVEDLLVGPKEGA